MSFLLLNTGDNLLLNDGTSKLLLNQNGGITITGEQQKADLQKRPIINVPVEFAFRVRAGIIPLKFFAQQTFEKLSVCSFDSKLLREAFVMPIDKLQFKLKKVKKRMEREYQLQTFGNLLGMASENDLIKSIGELFKR